MKILINESEKVKLGIYLLNKYYRDIKRYSGFTSIPNSKLFLNSKNLIVMGFDTKTDNLYVFYPDIWKTLEDIGHLSRTEILESIRIWVNEKYDINPLSIAPTKTIMDYLS